MSRRRAASHRVRVWIAVAALLAVAGSGCAFWAADSVAVKNRDHAQSTFSATATAVSSTLQLALQHEQDLSVTAAGYFARVPAASNANLQVWLDTTHALARYPELIAVGELVDVPAAGLPAFTAGLQSDPPAGVAVNAPLQLMPPGPRPDYCLARVGRTRTPTLAVPLGFDYCGGEYGPIMRAARDSGTGAYLPFGSGSSAALAVMTPVYLAAAQPNSVATRRAAFLGWVGTVFDPSVLLDQALAGHPRTAVTFGFSDGVSNASFHGGTAPAGAHAVTAALGGGWTVQTTAALPATGIMSSTIALALLGTGIGFSLVLAVLIVVLASTRSRAMTLVRQRTEQLRHQALHDALTGLPNRVLILDRIEQMLARNRRNGTLAAVLYVDLDGFKDINDSLGHAIGDRVLKAVTTRLRDGLRDVDTIGRMGGDEFVILTDSTTEPGGPQVVAERVVELLRAPFDIEGVLTPITITASVGLAIGHEQNPGELLREADTALYRAKAAGKDTFETFRQQMSNEVKRRFELEAELRKALERGQFELRYQPIYQLGDLRMSGVEALIRWNHPTRGEVSPDQFIPILECNTQIIEVGRWVLDTACEHAAQWRAQGHELNVSVNVSGRQLDRDAIVEDVRQALNRSGLDPDALTLEVTETAAMTNIDATAIRLQLLKALGVHIAIDDFGTGYSSLAYLQRLPADCLKIDRQFVDTINQSAESNTLVHTLIQLGQTLGMSTLAEGVETTEQLDYLRAENVDRIQGFLLAHPLTRGALERQLASPLAIASDLVVAPG